jgi:hypothetical protein
MWREEIMKWYFLLFILLSISLSLPLVLSLDSNLPIACGGDGENIIIGCLNTLDLIYLGAVPIVIPSGGQQLEPEITPEKEIVVVSKEPEYPFFSIANLNKFFKSKGLNQLDIYILEFFLVGIFICFLFLIYKKGEKKGKKKKEEKIK